MNTTRMPRMNTPRVGSVAKVCTEVSTPERTRNVPSRESEKVRIASRMVQTLSALRFSITTAECEQRRAGDPGHQRGVLDRVPEPPAAPAELVVGPVGAHRDPEREEHPGGERPRAHPARPCGVDLAVDQRSDRERERDREADIAEVEQRRMHREADVLQDRIEIAAFGRCVHDPRKRVRCGEDEQIEGAGDPGLHGEHIRLQARRQIGAEQRDQRAEQREDQHPQEHGALVVSPDAGELVDERHRRVRILEDVQHREVGADIAGGQRRKRRGDEHELRQCRRACDAHQRRIVGARAPQRHGRLNQRERERENERVVPELRRHFGLPCDEPARP